jgi:hypothetical protein
MSDEKKYTEREVIQRERRAFCEGVSAGPVMGEPWLGTGAEAVKRYPLPKVTRPRVVADPHSWLVERDEAFGKVAVYWTVASAAAAVNPCDHDGVLLQAPTPMARPTAARIALWADLLARPTEEVEA